MTDQPDTKDIYSAWFAAVAEFETNKGLFNENKGFLKFARQTVQAARALDATIDFVFLTPAEDLPKFEAALENFSNYLDETAGNLDPTNRSIVSPARLIENAERAFFENASERGIVKDIGVVLGSMLSTADRMIRTGVIESPVQPAERFWGYGIQNQIGWCMKYCATRYGYDLTL